MLDLGWSELLVVAVVALIVVGPKELPGMLRTIGKFVKMIRRQANEFRSQFDEAIKDTEFEQVRRDFENIKSDATATVRDAAKDIEDEFKDLDDVSRDIERQLNAQTDDGAGARAAQAVGSNDEAGPDDGVESRWMDDHNQAVLAAEQHASANGSTSVADIDDPGASDGDGEVEPAAPGSDMPKAVEKAGAAT